MLEILQFLQKIEKDVATGIGHRCKISVSTFGDALIILISTYILGVTNLEFQRSCIRQELASTVDPSILVDACIRDTIQQFTKKLNSSSLWVDLPCTK